MPDLPSPDDPDSIAAYFADLTLLAGAAIVRIAASGFSARLKADRSPVCEADEAAESIILDALRRDFPGLPVVAEEAVSRGEIPACGHDFVLVDALDGTREFVGQSGDYTVNIALVRGGDPCAGAVCAPALGHVWFGGTGAHTTLALPGARLPDRDSWRAIHTRAASPELTEWTAVASRHHADPTTAALLETWAISHRVMRGSSLKFCTIAEGQADVYPRFSPIMEWDIAAGDAVLRAAGGAVLGPDGVPLTYGHRHKDFRANGFVAWGDPQAGRATLKTAKTGRVLESLP